MKLLDMYSEVTKAKRMIRHIERLPLPFPMTYGAMATAIVLEVIMFKWVPFGNPLVKYIIIPLGSAAFISHFEPEGINLFQQVFRRLRKRFRPKKRVVNTPVAIKGTQKVYQQITYLHLERRESQ